MNRGWLVRVFIWCWAILLWFPTLVITIGGALLWDSWKAFKAQRGDYEVLPDPLLQTRAALGMGLVLMGYVVIVVYLWGP